MHELRDLFNENEDFARGASMSLRVTIKRVLWREARGLWPDEEISPTRRELERAIDHLIDSEVERFRRNEIFPHERAGRRVKFEDRRGQSRMKLLPDDSDGLD